MGKTGLFVAAALALVLLAPGSALAIEVNATGDQADPTPNDGICDASGAGCTLRAAIQTSQGTLNPGADTITFNAALGSTIELGNGLPTITQSLTVTGPGAANL